MDEVQAFIARNKHQFGYIMGEAARQWAAIDPVGALTVGPCVKQVEVYGEYWHLVKENEQLKNIIHTITFGKAGYDGGKRSGHYHSQIRIPPFQATSQDRGCHRGK